jgi:ligand-binding sensor domain-containing protein/signal transduction histidine kinase
MRTLMAKVHSDPTYSIITFLGIFLFIAIGHGQPHRLQFKHLTPDEGLSSSSVTCIFQDHKGFMWVGTYSGLNRYDGINFVQFRNNSLDSTSLPHNLVSQIFEDRRQQLWIATAHGLACYDWSKDRFINYMMEPSSPLQGLDCGVQSVAEDSLGNFWLGTTVGLVYFDRQNNKATRYLHDPARPASLSNDFTENVFLDSKNRLWITTRNGFNLWIADSGAFKRYNYDQTVTGPSLRAHFLNIVEDGAGNLWIASLGNGLYRLAPQDVAAGTMINYRHDPADMYSLSGNRILNLYVDSHDHLWIGTENAGLNMWDENQKKFFVYQNDEYNPSGLNNNSIHAIAEDQAGNFWIGTFAGGINISKFNGNAILYYQNLPAAPEGLTHNSVTSFEQDHQGRIWVGTDGGGINLFDEKTGHFRSFHTGNSGLTSDAVLSMVEDSQHRIWVGTWDGGLNRFDPETGSFRAYTTKNSALPEDNIFLVKEDKQGHLWLGSFQNGLIEFDPSTDRFVNYTTHNSNLSHDMVVEVEFDSKGILYVGTFYGLDIFNPRTKQFDVHVNIPNDPNSLSDNGIHDILVENDTTVWIATMDGLNCFNPVRAAFTRFNIKDGLPDNQVKGCTFDDSGHLWISTNKGLGRIDPGSKQCKIFTKADGLQSNEFNFRSVLRTRDGKLLFGGRKGFNVLYPENLIENRNIPRILITDFYIFNKAVKIDWPDSPLRRHISETEQLTLSYQQSVFTFGFAVMDFTIPEKNQYAFRMEGFDKNWNEVGTQRTATYTNLAPGKYTFRVKGANNDGLWNENGTAIKITITPPFWGTAWFRGVSMVMVAGILLVTYKARTTRMRKQNLELEQKIRERTAELEVINKELEAFSYSISHDLRAPLRSMNGFSEILLETYGNMLDNEGKIYLQRIRQASERMAHLIDDLLKLSRLSRTEMIMSDVNISSLAESIIDEMRKADPQRQLQFRCTDGLYVKGVESLLKAMLWNLLDNAWKFTARTSPSQIEFGALAAEKGVVYFIRDNGVGFDNKYAEKIFEAFHRHHPGFTGTGIGLGTAKRIIQRHGGSIWAEGKVNEGATFYFTLGWKAQLPDQQSSQIRPAYSAGT